MFTKMATIFTLIERNARKLDTTILNGMQKFCENLKFIAIVVFEIWNVKERHGRAGSRRFI